MGNRLASRSILGSGRSATGSTSSEAAPPHKARELAEFLPAPPEEKRVLVVDLHHRSKPRRSEELGQSVGEFFVVQEAVIVDVRVADESAQAQTEFLARDKRVLVAVHLVQQR